MRRATSPGCASTATPPASRITRTASTEWNSGRGTNALPRAPKYFWNATSMLMTWPAFNSACATCGRPTTPGPAAANTASADTGTPRLARRSTMASARWRRSSRNFVSRSRSAGDSGLTK